MELLAVSISHENTPISIREKVSFTKKKQAEILKYIKQNIAEECVLLSTCNRCEFYLAGYNIKDKFIDCLVSLTDEFVKKYISIYEGDDCSRHLALTASGLKSMILGEDQILGQVKDAHEFAKEHLCCGKYLNTLFRISVTGAKKVKTETLLSKTPVSAATIAIKQCQNILGTLNNKNILIIGANGFTGRRILNDLSVNPIYHVTGCSLRDDICPGKDYRFVRTDIRDENEVRKLFKECRPDIVINTSALSVPDYCETHHAEAEATNVTAVETIAHVCEQYGSRFVHLSTDFVFDGKSTRLYKEEDEAIPVNYYGVTKLKAEKIIASICSNYAIVRVVVVYGKALPGQHGNILQLVANRLRNGETIRVVSDQWRTPTFVGDISVGVEKLMFHTANGIYHICGSECLTIAEIAYRVADFLKLDRSLIEPVTTEEMKETTPRPRFSGLSIEKAKAEIGYTPRTLEEGMEASLF